MPATSCASADALSLALLSEALSEALRPCAATFAKSTGLAVGGAALAAPLAPLAPLGCGSLPMASPQSRMSSLSQDMATDMPLGHCVVVPTSFFEVRKP